MYKISRLLGSIIEFPIRIRGFPIFYAYRTCGAMPGSPTRQVERWHS